VGVEFRLCLVAERENDGLRPVRIAPPTPEQLLQMSTSAYNSPYGFLTFVYLFLVRNTSEQGLQGSIQDDLALRHLMLDEKAQLIVMHRLGVIDDSHFRGDTGGARGSDTAEGGHIRAQTQNVVAVSKIIGTVNLVITRLSMFTFSRRHRGPWWPRRQTGR
jgi:hypothetical protein